MNLKLELFYNYCGVMVSSLFDYKQMWFISFKYDAGASFYLCVILNDNEYESKNKVKY